MDEPARSPREAVPWRWSSYFRHGTNEEQLARLVWHRARTQRQLDAARARSDSVEMKTYERLMARFDERLAQLSLMNFRPSRRLLNRIFSEAKDSASMSDRFQLRAAET